jgi:hypothetical protein
MHCSTRRRFRRTSSLVLMVLLSPFAGTVVAQEPALFERAWQSGRPATITGVYTAVVADDFAKGEATRIDMVRDEQTGELFRVRYERDRPSDLRSGMRVQIAGRTYGSGPYGVDLFVAGCCDTNATESMSLRGTALNGTNAISSGDQRVLVIMANFTDATLSWSVDQVTNTMFSDPTGASVNALYRDNSRGQLSISGSVVGPFTIPYLSTQCATDAWGKAAEAAAANAGVDVASFPHRVYVLPTDSCPAAGLATVGGNPSYAWILTYTAKGVYAHEFGHNLGMDHAAIVLDGQVNDLGDGGDPMSLSSGALRGLNASHRHQLGWITPQVVTQSGSYDVLPLAQASGTVYTIAKPDTNEWYYLSTRYAQGYDSPLQPYYLNGLAIHRYTGKVLPTLGEVTKTYLVAELTDGQQFTDPVNGMTISQVTHDATHVTARVELTAVCIAASPSLSLSPQSQSGGPGLTASYTVSVTNRDGASCPASVFTLSAVVPSGWSSSLSQTSLTLAPGTSAQAVLTVASAPGTPPGTYISTFKATQTVQTSIEASATATYTVQPPADTTSPSAPSSLMASFNQKVKQIQLSWKPSSDNVGVAGYRVSRDGVLVGTSVTTSWNDSAYAPGVTYGYSVTAYDAAGNVSAASNAVQVAVSGGGKRK